jgi:hypothetical protein
MYVYNLPQYQIPHAYLQRFFGNRQQTEISRKCSHCVNSHYKKEEHVLFINQLDVTLFTSLFTLYMFRTILVHHQEFCFVRHAGLTKVCGVLEW